MMKNNYQEAFDRAHRKGVEAFGNKWVQLSRELITGLASHFAVSLLSDQMRAYSAWLLLRAMEEMSKDTSQDAERRLAIIEAINFGTEVEGRGIGEKRWRRIVLVNGEPMYEEEDGDDGRVMISDEVRIFKPTMI